MHLVIIFKESLERGHYLMQCTFSLFSNYSCNLEKTADILQRHHWFPNKMTSEKFHTDDISLPTSGLLVLLIGRAMWEIYFSQSEALPRSG